MDGNWPVSQQHIHIGNVFPLEHSTKAVLLHEPIFRGNSTHEIWKGQGLCWKTDYRLNRVVDLPVEAPKDWDWDEFCLLSETSVSLSSLLSKREAMWPILNLACLFKMQIPENKESDCTWHWKLGSQLWARLLCTQPHCSIYQSRQQHLLLFGYCCCPTPCILFEEAEEQILWSCSEAQSLLWTYFYRKKPANLMVITWSCWTHWILHKKGCFIILADNNSAAPSRLIFSVRI